MTKEKKLSIYRDVEGLIKHMKDGEEIWLFAPGGEETHVKCFLLDFPPLYDVTWEINGRPMDRVPEIIARLTRDVLAYWEQNPEEAKASGLG